MCLSNVSAVVHMEQIEELSCNTKLWKLWYKIPFFKSMINPFAAQLHITILVAMVSSFHYFFLVIHDAGSVWVSFQNETKDSTRENFIKGVMFPATIREQEGK